MNTDPQRCNLHIAAAHALLVVAQGWGLTLVATLNVPRGAGIAGAMLVGLCCSLLGATLMLTSGSVGQGLLWTGRMLAWLALASLLVACGIGISTLL